MLSLSQLLSLSNGEDCLHIRSGRVFSISYLLEFGDDHEYYTANTRKGTETRWLATSTQTPRSSIRVGRKAPLDEMYRLCHTRWPGTGGLKGLRTLTGFDVFL
jgi:hypothetical protein